MTITSTTLNRLSNTPIATPWAMPTALPVYSWRSIERIRSIAWFPRSRTLTCSRPWESSQSCRRSMRTAPGRGVELLLDDARYGADLVGDDGGDDHGRAGDRDGEQAVDDEHGQRPREPEAHERADDRVQQDRDQRRDDEDEHRVVDCSDQLPQSDHRQRQPDQLHPARDHERAHRVAG